MKLIVLVMKNYLLIFPLLVFVFVFAGNTHAQTISGSLGKGSVKKGVTTRGYIVLRIPRGLHVNSYKPKSEYAVPTKVNVSANGVNAFGVTYPPGKMRKFSFSDTPISVYENRAVFGFKVKVPRNIRRKYVRVKVSVRYQACTHEVCYAPKTKTIWITARVR